MQRLINRCRELIVRYPAAVTFLIMAQVQFLSYTNLVVNIRAITTANVPAAVATDVAASAISYFIIRRISKEETLAALFGMCVGGGLASWVGIELTRHWQ